jgi:membrane dipeptidase
MRLIVDSHEDLAWNIQTFKRDYLRPVVETRRLEAGSNTPIVNGDTLLGWPEYQRGLVAVVFATLFTAPLRRQDGDWDILCYADSNQAYDLYWSQLDLYHRLAGEHGDRFRLIEVRDDLKAVVDKWQNDDNGGAPIGLVILMEGAEGLRGPTELEQWWRAGVRLLGPAWAGNRYCGGTREPGGLTKDGYALLETMHAFNIGLDLSHMDDLAARQALDFYPGTIIATHSNCQSLLNDSDSNRHLSDQMIEGIIERNGVIGIVPTNAFLKAGWKRKDGRHMVTLEHLIEHIDHVCQIAGDALHVGIGTDFDGGFGVQSVPTGIDTIADLKKLEPLLYAKGYSDKDIDSIMGGNWLGILAQVLPLSL